MRSLAEVRLSRPGLESRWRSLRAVGHVPAYSWPLEENQNVKVLDGIYLSRYGETYDKDTAGERTRTGRRCPTGKSNHLFVCTNTIFEDLQTYAPRFTLHFPSRVFITCTPRVISASKAMDRQERFAGSQWSSQGISMGRIVAHPCVFMDCDRKMVESANAETHHTE